MSGTQLKVLKCLQGAELLEVVPEISPPLTPLYHPPAFRLAHVRSQTGTDSPDVPSRHANFWKDRDHI